jgi:hypothetical protein
MLLLNFVIYMPGLLALPRISAEAIFYKYLYLEQVHSAQNLLFSRLLSKNLKIRIYKTIISLVVLYGCETWSLTSREKAEGVRI